MTIEATLYDMAQLLESADGAAARVRRVLELLRVLVPYDQCALLDAGVGHPPRVVLVPDAALVEGTPPLLETLLGLFGQLVESSPGRLASSPRAEGNHLAVPLVGLDEVIGLLFVRSSAGYTERHLRALSVVAAKLAAYFTTLRDRAELTHLARERDEALRAAEVAYGAKEDLLRQLSSELKTPLDAVLACAIVLRSTLDDLPARTRAIDELERTVRARAARVQGIFARAFSAPAGARSGDVRPTRPPGGTSDDDRLAGIRVLLIEHDLGVREAIEAALDHHGAAVTAVSSAPEALAALDRRQPHVLLFGDLPARGDSVDELMREVTARASPLPVASISTQEFEDRHRSRAAGFRLHLAKPIEMTALVEAVAELAGRTDVEESRNVGHRSRS